jgi:ABC-type uncharacterized transport system substrate-binding protein
MRSFLRLLPFLAASAVQAHPHEFVDVSLLLRVTPEFQLAEIGVEWRYDAFTSMLILSDLDLDPAATELDEVGHARLLGFDLDWIEGYDGDLWVWDGERQLAVGPPRAGAARLEDGEIITRHWRSIDPVHPAQDLVLQVYDPEFYIAYTLRFAQVEGPAPCRARVFETDLGGARERLEAMLDELYAGGGDIEADFPQVGRSFADEVLIDCATPAP